MSRKNKNNREGAPSILLGILLLMAGALAVFYAAYKVSYVSVDYGIHVGIAKELDLSDPVRLFREHTEPVWHLLVRAVMKGSTFIKKGGFSAERAAGVASGGLCALTYLLAAGFLYRFANGAMARGSADLAAGSSAGFTERTAAGASAGSAIGSAAGASAGFAGNSAAGASSGSAWGPAAGASSGGPARLSLPGAALASLALNLSSAVFVPWFNDKPYLGQGSPNPWHNPTTLTVRPIGLLIFLLVMGECERARRAGFGKGSGLKIWKGLLIAALLLLSNLSKPSFVQIFYPAIFVLMLLWLVLYRGRNFPLGVQLLLCCLPSVALMGLQFFTAFYGKTNSQSAGVVIAPFKVAGLYTDNIAVSTLLVLAFPLLVLLCAVIRRSFDWTAAFAWIMLLAGMAEKFLLAEGGSRMAHGNFNWGYILALYFVWFVGMRDLLLWKNALGNASVGNTSSGNVSSGNAISGNSSSMNASLRAGSGRGGAARFFSTAGFLLCVLVLLAHLVSGIYYLYYLIVLGNGI